MHSQCSHSHHKGRLCRLRHPAQGRMMPSARTRRGNMQLTYQDQEQLRMLSVFHYILAGLLALVACIPLIHVAIGVAMMMGLMGRSAGAPPAFVGMFFVIIGGLFIVLGWTLAICIFLAGRNL